MAPRSKKQDLGLSSSGPPLLSSVVGFCVYNSGNFGPMVGLATRNLKKESAENAVYEAIKVGIKSIDTSLSAGNQKEIGRGIKRALDEKLIKREKLFITTKLPDLYHHKVEDALREELRLLNLDYSDLHLIETPWQQTEGSSTFDMSYKTDTGRKPIFLGGDGITFAKSKPLLQDTWSEMEKLKEVGLARDIGVMNFDQDLIEKLLQNAKILPATNQIECHFLLQQKDLVKYLREKNIMITANTCIPPVEAPDFISDIGKGSKHSPKEVLLRYLCQKGIQIVYDAEKLSDIMPLERLGFALSGEEMKKIENCDKSQRFQYFKNTSIVENRNYPKSWTKEAGFGDAKYSKIGFKAQLDA